MSIPPKATGLVRVVYGLNSLTDIGILDMNGNTNLAEISNCSKLTTISEFRNINNIIYMYSKLAHNKILNFKLNSSDWWDREIPFKSYNDVFYDTSMVNSNPDMPKSWGGSKSLPTTSVTFSSNAPMNNPPDFTNYFTYIDTWSPRYGDNLTWSISSPSNLCHIDNQATIRFKYKNEWNNFTGTEECILTGKNSSNDVVVSLTITLTK